MSTHVSAIERLQALPDMFRGADLTVRCSLDSKTASQYLYLWKRRGLVRGLGGHTDVWVNMLATKHPDWERAVLMVMPSAVVVGVEALRRAGWTTQIQQRPTVAVNARQRRYQTDPFEIDFRGARWFKASASGIVPVSAGQLPVLSPAWALADLLRQQDWGDFGLQRDDIEWDEVGDVDEAQWEAACAAYGLPRSKLLNQIVYSR